MIEQRLTYSFLNCHIPIFYHNPVTYCNILTITHVWHLPILCVTTNVCVCTCVCVCACACACMCVGVCVHVHTRMLTRSLVINVYNHSCYGDLNIAGNVLMLVQMV